MKKETKIVEKEKQLNPSESGVLTLEDVEVEQVNEDEKVYSDPNDDPAFIELAGRAVLPKEYDKALADFIDKYPLKAEAYKSNKKAGVLKTGLKNALKRKEAAISRDKEKEISQLVSEIEETFAEEGVKENLNKIYDNPYDDTDFLNFGDKFHEVGNSDKAIEDFLNEFPDKAQKYLTDIKSSPFDKYYKSYLKHQARKETPIQQEPTEYKEVVRAKPAKKTFWSGVKNFFGF